MLAWPVALCSSESAVPVLSLVLALSSAPAQYIGGYPNPRLPLGRAAALGAFRPNAPYVIREPGAAWAPPPPVVIERTIVYVVVPRVIVRPSEVIFEPPEVRFVTVPETDPATPPPSDPATGSGSGPE